VLPNQKTHQHVETFEHKWQWFLAAPGHEKLCLVKIHAVHIQNVIRWGFPSGLSETQSRQAEMNNTNLKHEDNNISYPGACREQSSGAQLATSPLLA
jgi:hypothetical protein